MKRCTRYHHSQLLKDYLHGNVSAKKKEIEFHLNTCETCAETLEQLKRGEHFAQMIPRKTDAPDGWQRLQQTLDSSHRLRWKEQKRIASIAGVLLVGALVIYSFFARSESNASFSPAERNYKEVHLSQIAENTEAHIVTEGVVSAIAIDNQDGDYRIRLQENLRQSGPFVICEILRPSKIQLPQVGKRVRVYGVSRFDNKPDHRWHEVHPVFGIETVQ